GLMVRWKECWTGRHMKARAFLRRVPTLLCKHHREQNSLFSGPRRLIGILSLRNFPIRGGKDRSSSIAFGCASARRLTRVCSSLYFALALVALRAASRR